jgi:DNA end-binding protein Ku
LDLVSSVSRSRSIPRSATPARISISCARKNLSRIRFLKVAEKDNKPVDKDELVKGYEYEKGRYVVLTKEDFETAAVKRNSAIELLDFVPADEVDDRYFDKPYYLLPSKGRRPRLRAVPRRAAPVGQGRASRRS